MSNRFAYFDTSVLVKKYIREAGSHRARQFVLSRQIITSAVSGLECISAFRRNHASGSIDEKAYAAIVKQFQRDRNKLELVAVTPDILTSAEKYVSEFNVRALDAIHLASATVLDQRLPNRLEFVTADSVQRNAALRLNLRVIWVE